MDLNVVRRISIEASTKGVDEVTSKLSKLGAAQDNIAATSERTEKASLSVERAFERQQRSLDQSYRSMQQFERAQRDLDNAYKQGMTTTSRYLQLTELNRQRLVGFGASLNQAAAANDNFAARTGLAGYAVRNLGFQINDVATMLAMGASPFQVLASQGGQVYQILGSSERGVVGAIKGMGASIVATLGPIGLAAAGLTALGAAALYFWKSSQEPAKTTEELLEEQVRLIKLVEAGYKEGASAADKFAASVSAVTRAQEEANTRLLRARMMETANPLVYGGPLGSVDPTTGKDFQVARQFEAFAGPIKAFEASLAAGIPNVREFREEVARLAEANPGLKDLRDKLLGLTEPLLALDPTKLQQTREELERITDLNAQKGFSTAYQSLLGAAPEANKEELRQQKLLKIAQDRAKALEEINKSEALFATRTANTAKVDEAYRRAVAEAMKDQPNAYEKVMQKADERIEQLKLEVQGYGKTAEAVIKLKLQQEAERAAKEAGIPVNQKVIDQTAKEIALLEQKKKFNTLRDNIQFDRDTMFFSDREREIAREMKNLYGPEWQANMDSVEAKQLRINDAMKEMRDTTADFAKTFVQGMMDGKSASQALIGALDQLGKKMMSQGIDRAVNGLFSGNPAEMIGGGIQAAVGWGLQQFQKREQEKRAAAEAALEAERKADDLRRSRRAITEQYTLRKSLGGLDETQQGDALAAFDLRAANEMLQARRLPGNLKKEQILLIEETLAAERLKIIEDFAKRAAEIERSYEDRIFAATNDTSTLEGALAAFDRAAAREREQAVEAGGIAIGKLEEALAAERLRLIEDFVGKANMAESRRLGYADRLFAATNDTSTLEGQLALFDRQAQRDREQEIANGGEAINELEAALAAERLQIIQQFVDQASAASARLLSYQDRLFAATNDTSTLAGQLAAFDRQAQRDREAEIAAGGEAILELEAALNAERLNVIQQFNSRIVDETKQAEEQRRQALIQTTQQVLQYIQQLQTGTQSPLSPGARLAAAQASYDSTRALAMGGNADAYAQFTQVAESLRQAAKDMYGSAAGYQTIFNNIVADGLNLTAPVAASDPVVAKLQEVVTAIGVANGSIVASTNGNVAAINAVTGAVNTQGNAASVYHNNTRLAVVGTTTAVDLTRTAVGATTTAVGANATTVSSAVGATTTAVGATTTAVNTNNNLVTTGNTIANDQLTEAQQAEALLNAIKGLGDIQRSIGNAASAQAASIGTQTVFKLTQINRALDNQAGSSSGTWDWLGFESGGVVGNGRWGRDSVMARYAGGGNIMLAGGEGVLTAGATAAIGGRAAIDYINRTGMMPANDNGGVIAAIASLQAEVRYLRAELAAVGREGNKIAAAHLEHDRDWGDRDQRQNKVAAPKVSRAA